MLKRIKYITEITYHYILVIHLQLYYRLTLNLYMYIWHLRYKNLLGKIQLPSEINYYDKVEKLKNKRDKIRSDISCRYTYNSVKQCRIIENLKYKNHLRVMQKNDILTITIRKIRNLLKSKYRYLKYEKYKKQ